MVSRGRPTYMRVLSGGAGDGAGRLPLRRGQQRVDEGGVQGLDFPSALQ